MKMCKTFTGILSLAFLAMVLSAAPASAEPVTTGSFDFVVLRCKIVTDPDVGAEIRVAGTVKFERHDYSAVLGMVQYENIRVVNSIIRVATKDNTCAQSGAPKTVGKARLKHYYYQEKCASNISVGFPFGISASLDGFTCNSTQAGGDTVTFGGNSNFYQSTNEGGFAKIARGALVSPSTTRPCVPLVASATIWNVAETLASSATFGDNEDLHVGQC